MANWLQKITSSLPKAAKSNLPANIKSNPLSKPGMRPAPTDKLPPASMVYGMAASGLVVVALGFILKGLWFTGFLVLLPAACFLGFAIYFLKTR